MATLFVYPSTYEGFGLPPLEALACGTPVVVAQSSSLPEVVGENATFMDPYDYQNIAEALEKSLQKDQLPNHAMRFKGIQYSKQFSWQNMAKKTLEIYSNVLNS
jgi:glycosyltransferase involved in cell wall biosynthesis